MMKKILLLSLATTSAISCPNFVLIGPPGSGKGTFSRFMVEEKGYHQICLGDIVRVHKKNNSEIGKAIAAKNGFVDDELAYKIISDNIAYAVEKELPFIVDGFPRNVPAYDFLVELFAQHAIGKDIVFAYFNIDDQTCIERIDARLVCFNCLAVFNATTKKPKEAMKCDDCGHSLEVRDGDTTTATIKRLAYYREHTEPLVELAKKHFQVLTIDAKSPIAYCIELYKKIISK